MGIKNRVYCFILFSITTIRSADTLKTASEILAAFDNVVSAHGHPFPVDECSEGGNVWVMDIARPGLNMRSDRHSPVGWRLARIVAKFISTKMRNFAIAVNVALYWMFVLGHHPVKAQQ